MFVLLSYVNIILLITSLRTKFVVRDENIPSIHVSTRRCNITALFISIYESYRARLSSSY